MGKAQCRASGHRLEEEQVNASRTRRRMGPRAGASLVTDTPEDGCALAVRLVGHVIHSTQSEADARNTRRLNLATRPGSSIAASQTLAIAFRIIAEVNNDWR